MFDLNVIINVVVVFKMVICSFLQHYALFLVITL